MSAGPAPHVALAAVTHEHLPALIFAGLAAVLTSLLAARIDALRRHHLALASAIGAARSLIPGDRLALGLLLISAIVHLALVPTHLDQPLLAILFAAAGAGFIAVAAAAVQARSLPWRAAGSVLAAGTVLAYLAALATGVDQADLVGLGTKVLEVAALFLLIQGRGSVRQLPRPFLVVMRSAIRSRALQEVLCDLASRPGGARFDDLFLPASKALEPALRDWLGKGHRYEGVVVEAPAPEIKEHGALSRILGHEFETPLTWVPSSAAPVWCQPAKAEL